MADRVMLAGVRRSGEILSCVEIKQMIGRAGRKHDQDGHVDIFLKDEDAELESQITQPTGDIQSGLNTYDSIIFHMLPVMACGKIKSTDDCSAWWKKSLASVRQGEPVWSGFLDGMRGCGLVKDFTPTEYGMVSVDLMFYPLTVSEWANNFNWMFKNGLENNDIILSNALGNVHYYKMADHIETLGIFEQYKEAWQSIDNTPSHLPEKITNSVVWWSMLGCVPLGQSGMMKVREARRDVGRVISALLRLNKIVGWGKEGYIEMLLQRLQKGIPACLIPLYSARPDMTKNLAVALYEAGVKTVEDYNDFGKDFSFEQ